MLEGETVEIAGVPIAGGTLWTDFELFGDAAQATRVARYHMNDYERIRARHGWLEPSETLSLHKWQLSRVGEVLTRSFEGRRWSLPITPLHPHLYATVS